VPPADGGWPGNLLLLQGSSENACKDANKRRVSFQMSPVTESLGGTDNAEVARRAALTLSGHQTLTSPDMPGCHCPGPCPAADSHSLAVSNCTLEGIAAGGPAAGA